MIANAQLTQPIERFLEVIQGRHKAIILIRLSEGPMRYSQLVKILPEVSERVLNKQLRDLEEQGVIHREVYPESPPRVEYSLTNYGSTLCPILKKMWKWGEQHEQLKK